jgi:hypothetical protein
MKMSKTYLLGAIIAVFGMFGAFTTPVSAATPAAIHTADPLQVLPEVTDANAADLLLNSKSMSLVVSFSAKEASPAQQQQLEMIARESHDYAGLVGFYLLNVDKYPNTWAAISKGQAWTHGLNFRMINASVKPVEAATISDVKNGVQIPKQSLTKKELRDNINNFLKVAPLVWHITDAQQVFDTGVPAVIMVYRSSSPQTLMLPMQFQNYAYESQLYPNRVAFFLLDLDQYDASSGLGMTLPKQDNAYYVLFVPGKKLGSGVGMVIDNQLLNNRDLEYDIYSYFGTNYGPIKVPNAVTSPQHP